VIPRKGIEMTIELASRVDSDPVVVVTHTDDLDREYWAKLENQAAGLGVDLRLVDAGRDLSALASAYAAADLVCVPSMYEGYGNALVEAVYHRRPVLVNRFPVYRSDIAPLGFRFVEIEGMIRDETVTEANRIIGDERHVDCIVDHNFGIGEASLSYSSALGVIEQRFSTISGG
jgi:glycosyltransferase involved in cell wall biosynthesis